MSEPSGPPRDEYPVEQLTDYLDRGRTPRDPQIESSPQAQMVLAALARLRSLSVPLIERDGELSAPLAQGWIATILSRLGTESRAGRMIPLSHPDPAVQLHVTEGAVRGLLRTVGDAVPGVLMISCSLAGEVTVPGALVTVNVAVSVYWRESIPSLIHLLRDALSRSLVDHTELHVAAINITVADAHAIDVHSREARLDG
ncbi:Asp23/Gls24 family envelope stress response protein [Glaciibacter psychrotolerans]|uniref:Asp23/Gls24 family envelope stress response protein n=1 Tax=Glaciibacter psychrotolerans TaxID=670054 RepID=A0A7Z0EDL2_9MICO|nr:Asp23/Gls24 family envelope stress response protein [Leifsonia psychrotolerans]NYJ19501.1 hypothetical protein [Leifsonia psychrotolerans]